MAIDAKVNFLSQVEHALSEKVTVSDMARLMSTISDVLQCFRMESVQNFEIAQNDDILRCFVTTMQIQGRSQKTVNRYSYIIGRFMRYTNVLTRQINVYHIRNWIASEKERGIADSTLEGCRQVLSAYFGWLYRENLIERNPMANVGVIKVPKKQKKTYSSIDIEKLKRGCKTLRDRAIVYFLQATGCRISEMTSLDRNMIDLEALECTVNGKGGKDRVVYIDSVTAEVLKEYLKSRNDILSPLFIGKRGERLQPGGVRVMLSKLGISVGVEHVHPHKFRRTKATEMVRRGMPIQEVAAILGHEKLDTTMEYVVLNKTDTKYNYEKYA